MSLAEKIAITVLLVAWAAAAIRTLFENRRLVAENKRLRDRCLLLTGKVIALQVAADISRVETRKA